MTDNKYRVSLKPEQGESKDACLARVSSSPVLAGALTHKAINKKTGLEDYSPPMNSLMDHLDSLTSSGDTGESALLVQAVTLDKLFNHLIGLAFNGDSPKSSDHYELWLKFALRAQSQCRTTYEAISTIRHPRIQYVGEQYTANNMQVNKAPTPDESKNQPNKLTEGLPEDALNDIGATTGSSVEDQKDSAVVEIDRAKKRSGKIKGVA